MAISESVMAKRYTSLTDYLDRSGETQEELAARVELSQPTISEAKRGKGSYKTFLKIHKATGVPLDSFDRKDAA
jgi:transcriptional regulator with XRE-family HTH domain